MAKKSSTYEVKPAVESVARIKVVGVGGSGGAAINRMLIGKVRGVEFIAVNTDVQALQQSSAHKKIQIGKEATRGLGSGMDPEIGMKSAEENEEEIRKHVGDADMIFITCGLGGGTGSGAAPIIADIARSTGALTVAIVTKPFKFEGAQRRKVAEEGLDRLIDKVDTIITIPNDRLLQIVDRKTSLINAFSVVDDVLRQGVIGISELVTIPGMINVDFADVRAIMANAGTALMGIGVATGDTRAATAARLAVESPLLEVSIEGARGILFVVTGGSNLSMHEINEAAEIITSSSDPEAKIIFGTVIDESMGDEIKITVIATGFRNFGDRGIERYSQQAIEREEPLGVESFEVDDEDEVPKERRLFTKSRDIEKRQPEDAIKDELDIPAFIRNRMKK